MAVLELHGDGRNIDGGSDGNASPTSDLPICTVVLRGCSAGWLAGGVGRATEWMRGLRSLPGEITLSFTGLSLTARGSVTS